MSATAANSHDITEAHIPAKHGGETVVWERLLSYQGVHKREEHPQPVPRPVNPWPGGGMRPGTETAQHRRPWERSEALAGG